MNVTRSRCTRGTPARRQQATENSAPWMSSRSSVLMKIVLDVVAIEPIGGASQDRACSEEAHSAQHSKARRRGGLGGGGRRVYAASTRLLYASIVFFHAGRSIQRVR